MLLSGPKWRIMEVARHSKGKVSFGRTLRGLEDFCSSACLGFILKSTVSLEEIVFFLFWFGFCCCFFFNKQLKSKPGSEEQGKEVKNHV